MDQRKYIDHYSLYFLCFLILFLFSIYHQKSYANTAWLPQPGKYKFFNSMGIIDEKSRNSRKSKQSRYLEVKDKINNLRNIRNAIKGNADRAKRDLRNSETHIIDELNQEIENLENLSNDLQSYNDEVFADMTMEYGLNDSESMGITLHYALDKFIEDNLSNKHIHSRNIEFFYKNKIYQDQNNIVSLQPKITFDGYGNNSSRVLYDIALLIGNCKYKRRKNIYNDFAVFIGGSSDKFFLKNPKFGVSMTNGVRFANGFILSNYIDFTFSKIDRRLYQRVVYEQIAIAKEINFANLGDSNFTIQFGYFAKTSLVDKSFTSSGPTFALWFSI